MACTNQNCFCTGKCREPFNSYPDWLSKMSTAGQGWECPKCKTVYAPTVQSCRCSTGYSSPFVCSTK